jgi:Cu/Ag efflux protein CusF
MIRRYISAVLMLVVTVFSVGPALALETLPGEPEIGDTMEATREPAVPFDERLATGKVVAVDRAAGRITLEFRPIPQLFLEGGTRIFRVGDPASLKNLRPGDKVRFEVERDGRRYTVTRLENSN